MKMRLHQAFPGSRASLPSGAMKMRLHQATLLHRLDRLVIDELADGRSLADRDHVIVVVVGIAQHHQDHALKRLIR
jgi:hypothetical protein